MSRPGAWFCAALPPTHRNRKHAAHGLLSLISLLKAFLLTGIKRNQANPGAETAAAAPAAGDEDDDAMVDDDEGALAAAPQPGPLLRSITIPKSKKRKGAPSPTLEDVRNAAGVGDAPAQRPAGCERARRQARA